MTCFCFSLTHFKNSAVVFLMTLTFVLLAVSIVGCDNDNDSQEDDPAAQAAVNRCSMEQCGGGTCNWNDDVLTCTDCPPDRSGERCEILPECTGVIAFGAREVELAVRQELDISSGEITAEDMLLLESLVVTGAFFEDDDCTLQCYTPTIKSYSNLTGLHCAKNLTSLHFTDMFMPDLTPLGHLTNLTDLDLSNSSISNISALSSLVNLVNLNLSQNYHIVNIQALGSMKALEKLNLSSNNVASVAPICHLLPVDGTPRIDLWGNDRICADVEAAVSVCKSGSPEVLAASISCENKRRP